MCLLADRVGQEPGLATPRPASGERANRVGVPRWAACAAALLCGLCRGVDAEDATPGPQELIVGVSDQPPFCMRDEQGEWCGITFDLWKHIAATLKLSYRLEESDLAGMVKGLDERTYDLEVCPAFITAIGEEHVDFTAPYFVDDNAIAVNADQQPSFWRAGRAVLSSGPFLLLVAAVVVVTLLGAITLWVIEHRGESGHYAGRTGRALLRAVYWSVSLLSGRDFPSAVGYKAAAPETPLGRAFAVAWMLFGVVLLSLFTASAASLLTFTQLRAFISDWGDLKEMRVGTVEQSDAQEYLRESQIVSTGYDTPVALLDALRRREIDAAVFGRAGLVYYAKKQFRNQIVVLPLASPQRCMGLPMQLESPLRKQMNRALLAFTESTVWPEIVARYQK